jgi:hypothetical protein
MEWIFYFLFLTIPSWLLTLAAMLFNAMVALTLSSKMYSGSAFIPTAWAVVRDLSNIFFILVLLYIAIRLILGIGGSEGKKMIVQVIIMALLINFSMFFTEVVIDSSNIIALVFYNKIDVCTTVAGQSTPGCAPYLPVTNIGGEKDISGGMVKAFNPSLLLSQDFWTKAKVKTEITPPGIYTQIIGGAFGGLGALAIGWNSLPSNDVPIGLVLGIMFVSGAIMLFAFYCFFIAAISFLSRLIELWVSIIFSPFAFMSSTIPILNDVEYIGWKSWLSRLLNVAFMAPIFMFFLYFIFLIIHADMFGNLMRDKANQTTTETILFVIIPALVILILLLKATHFAKKASGTLGEMLIKTMEIAMGATLGLGLGATAALGQGTLGHWGKMAADSKKMADWETKGNWAQRKLAGAGRTIGGGAAKSSFDARKGAVGGVLAAVGGISGLDLGHKTKYFMKEAGGYEADLKRRDEKRKARADGLKTKEGEKEKQNLNKLEEDLEGLKQVGSYAIEQIDNQIKGAQAAVAAAESTLRGETAGSGTAAIGTPGAVGYVPASANYTPASAGYTVAQSEVKKYAALVNDLRKEKSTIKNADSTKITALLAAATVAETSAATPPVGASAADIVRLTNAAKAARAAADVANASIKYGGVSMNNLEDTIIPDAKNLVNNLSKQRARDLATNIQKQWAFPWNRAARAKSAHEMRMGAKIETTK